MTKPLERPCASTSKPIQRAAACQRILRFHQSIWSTFRVVKRSFFSDGSTGLRRRTDRDAAILLGPDFR